MTTPFLLTVTSHISCTRSKNEVKVPFEAWAHAQIYAFRERLRTSRSQEGGGDTPAKTTAAEQGDNRTIHRPNAGEKSGSSNSAALHPLVPNSR